MAFLANDARFVSIKHCYKVAHDLSKTFEDLNLVTLKGQGHQLKSQKIGI